MSNSPESFPSVKLCTRCGEAKDRETGYHRDRNAPDGRSFYCKVCSNEIRNLRHHGRLSTPYKGAMNFFRHCCYCDLWKPRTDFYQRKDGRRSPGVCKDCRKQKSTSHYHANRERLGSAMKAAAWRLRLEMIEAYGGRCACCGVEEPKFLTIDHVNGGGRKHRLEVSNEGVIRQLKKEGWPREGYRLLCWNCNCTRGFFGYCPHETNGEDLRDILPYRLATAKRCPRCGVSKPRTPEFWPTWKDEPYGAFCRPCANEYQRLRHRATMGLPIPETLEDGPSLGILRQCAKCRLWKLVADGFSGGRYRGGWCCACVKEIGRQLRQRSNLRVKQETIAAYGGKCVCCGESHWQFLTIDHIHGDGAVERRRGAGGTDFYRELRRQGFPKERYRLLCWNCNCARGSYGHCPHDASV